MASQEKEVNCEVSSAKESLRSPTVCIGIDCHGVSGNEVTSSSLPKNMNPREESATCLLTPPNVHISHCCVYNFSPEISRDASPFAATLIQVPPKYQSPAASSGPICRICHEGDEKEDLVSPCRCSGTVGVVHKTCMERWLSTRNNSIDRCEICNYIFATTRSPRSFLEFIQSGENDSAYRRTYLEDFLYFLLVTTFAVLSSYLCLKGAKEQILWGNSLISGCLVALATFIITIYFTWIVLSVRFQLRSYLKWRKTNRNVRLLRVTRISTASDDLNTAINTTVVIPIPDSAGLSE